MSTAATPHAVEHTEGLSQHERELATALAWMFHGQPVRNRSDMYPTFEFPSRRHAILYRMQWASVLHAAERPVRDCRVVPLAASVTGQ